MNRLLRSVRAALARALSGSDEASQLSQARRALGAGPTWGRPAAAVLVLAYAAGVLLACHSGWLTTPTRVLAVAVCGGVALTLTARWTRGVDFNAWVEADPRHRRGSCQWLIWRGEYSGQPCLACLASMPRHERRRWLRAAASPAVTAGWLGEPGPVKGTPAPVRDAGAVPVGWLAWQLLPVGLLAAAVHQWTSSNPADRQSALPMALAVVLVAGINLHRARQVSRPSPSTVTDEPSTSAGSRGCDSCQWAPASVTVRFGDGVQFDVCAPCLATGVHHTAPQVTHAAVTEVPR